MKRFIPVIIGVGIILISLIAFCFAETVMINKKPVEIIKDAKGWYYLNDNGSKMRFSDADLTNVRNGQPFMSTLSAEDMSQKDIEKLETDRAKSEQDRITREKEQAKQALINEKMKALAIEQLTKEGKLDANGEIPK